MIHGSPGVFFQTIRAEPVVTLNPFVNDLTTDSVNYRKLSDSVTGEPVCH